MISELRSGQRSPNAHRTGAGEFIAPLNGDRESEWRMVRLLPLEYLLKQRLL
jgi:hypothetical protein